MSNMNLRAAVAITAIAAATLAANAPARAQAGYDASGATDVRANHFAGRDYCWYRHAWRGPGWYVCGYSWRHGFGWGGYDGWRGWYPHWHHHHHPHWPHPRPGPGRPPGGGHPVPPKPPR